MSDAMRTLLVHNGLILFFTTLKFVQQAPVLHSHTNSSLGETSSVHSPNRTILSKIFLLKGQDKIEESWYNIHDGQSIQQKQIVVNYLSAIEEQEEKEHHVSLKSTIKTIPYIFEEDIILTPHQAQILYEARNPRQKRKLETDLQRHWQLPIQYAYDGSHNDTEKAIIKSALHYWESFTCITFEEIAYRDNNSVNENQVYIVFTNKNNCWSFVGRGPNTEQKVSVSERCMYEGHVLHEIGHVIGFWHEHARPDRDRHITVQNDSILEGKKYNFIHISWKDLDTKDMPYDVGSIMHYGSTAFTIKDDPPALPTIITKDPLLQRALGQRFQLSYYDVKLANVAYCTDVCNKSLLKQPCQHDGYQDPKQCAKCRCTEGLGGDYCETAAPSVGRTCGGIVNLSTSPTLVGFPWAYSFGQQCSWFIKAPANNRIFFAIESTHVMDFEKCSVDPYIECLSYIEVRYAHNIAKTGARICCSYLPTTKPIVSEGNEMLVIMRANGNGGYGFQANVWAEPCGGCMSGTESTHEPCSKKVEFVCQYEWTYTVHNACPDGNWITGANCNQKVNKTAVRSGICSRSELYCCHGYKLNNNNTCVKSASMTTTHVLIHPDLTSAEYSVPTNNPTGNKENDQVVGWGNWSSWSNCSQPCGGCGNQTHERFCYNALLCNGKSVETETRPCNVNPCYTTNIGTRDKTVDSVCFNHMTLQEEKCTKTVKETYTYITETCCVGYSKSSNGVCLPDTT